MLPTKSPGSIRFDTLDRSPDDEISDVIDQHEIQAQKILDRRERAEKIQRGEEVQEDPIEQLPVTKALRKRTPPADWNPLKDD